MTWRCYEPSALTADLTAYANSGRGQNGVCTHPRELELMLRKCQEQPTEKRAAWMRKQATRFEWEKSSRERHQALLASRGNYSAVSAQDWGRGRWKETWFWAQFISSSENDAPSNLRF